MVLPVPGLPAKTRCRLSGGGGRPASWRRLTICIRLTSVPDVLFGPVQTDQLVELGEQFGQASLRIGVLIGLRIGTTVYGGRTPSGHRRRPG